MDETSVQVKPSRKMVCLAPMNKKKNIYKGKAKNGRLISLAVTITARGKLLKTLVIIPNKCVSEKTFEKSDLEDFFWTYSKKGFMNKKIFLQWVNKIFIPTVIKIRKKQNLDENERALLILDGHSSRINFPALVLMRINCVDVVIIPSHSSHILQPLDVGVFHIFKSNLRKAKLNQDDNPFLTIDECLIQSTTKKKIIGAFKKCGLFPLDLSKVINHPGIFPTEVQKIYGRVNTGRRLHLGGKLISSKEMIKQMKEKFERQMKKKHKEVISSMYDELLDGLENSKGINKEQVQFLHMPNYLFDQPFDKRVLRGDDTDEQFEKFLENCEPSQKFVQSVHEINTTLTKSPNCELPTIPSNLNKKNGQNENINSNQNSDPIEKILLDLIKIQIQLIIINRMMT
ncbi:hypothetical protein M0813_28750 [Anaeramoeba flamelloides]|uniref:DDE-1 domain-containing protein n=1 Tax=Anaeramoeba flamelloides TaxID=1746091 RepID=A0ABQ8XU51_9EUKA|nr:hypothetical protein M0813_28750 [Anaeramoeba flamelloides]